MKFKFVSSIVAVTCWVGTCCAGVTTTAFADESSAQAALSNGAAELSRNAKQEIQETMTEVLEELLEKDFEGIVDNFAKADRDRIGKLSESTSSAMKSLVKELKDSWEIKYGHSMSLRGANIPYEIARGQADKSVTVALLSTPAGLAVPMRLIDEGMVTSSWRIDVPDSTSNSSLKTNLETTLRQLNQDKANWPADEKEAYRILALKVFGAINGQVS